jgi:polyhydroxyalkanoate synthesis regulator phasin
MSEKEKGDKGIADVIKKVVSIGVGAAFMTEDAVKNLVGDIPLPKDILNGLVQNAKGAKEDLSNSMREEFRKYLSKLDLNRVAEGLVEKFDIEVTASVRFKKKKTSEEE